MALNQQGLMPCELGVEGLCQLGITAPPERGLMEGSLGESLTASTSRAATSLFHGGAEGVLGQKGSMDGRGTEGNDVP